MFCCRATRKFKHEYLDRYHGKRMTRRYTANSWAVKENNRWSELDFYVVIGTTLMSMRAPSRQVMQILIFYISKVKVFHNSDI